MRIALSLGSGGARGYAHIGVIEEIEARGHEIVAVAGTSMGALVGGVYAAGKLPEFIEWANDLSQVAVLKLLDLSPFGPGVIKADRVVAEVAKILDNARIENLPIPYTAVASDLTAGREVWFQHGPVDMAIRASIAIPSVITPVNLDGHILVDGGVMNPVPLEPLSAVIADATVAVALSGRPTTVGPHPTVTAGAETYPPEDWAERFWRSAGELLENELVRGVASRFFPKHEHAVAADGDAAVEAFETLPESLKTVDVATMSLDLMQAAIERYRMAANPPSVLVTIPAAVAGTYEFHRAQQVADVGRQKAIAAFDAAGL